MRRLFFSLVLTFVTLLYIHAPGLKAHELTLLTEKASESSFTCGTDVCGYSVEIVKEIMSRLNMKAKIKLVPWKRGYARLSNTPNVGLFLTSRTKQRDPLFHWCGPVTIMKFVFLKHRSSGIEISRLDDAKEYVIGTYADDVREHILINAGFDRARMTHLHGNDADKANFILLLKKRIDLWLTSVEQPGFSFEEIKTDCRRGLNFELCNVMQTSSADDFIEQAYELTKSYAYIAFSKGTDTKIVQQWQTALMRPSWTGIFWAGS